MAELESRNHFAVTPIDAQLLSAVNIDRAGLPQLTMSDSLDTTAQAWADHLASTGTLTHVGDNGSVPLDRAQQGNPMTVYCVENAGLTGPIWATDQASLEARALDFAAQINAHPGHDIQTKDPHTRQAGFGIATGFYNGMNCLWVVEEFGTIKPGIPDADGNGVVDSGDFTVMSANFGQTNLPIPSWEMGDFSGDGVVNAIDFNALASQYGVSE